MSTDPGTYQPAGQNAPAGGADATGVGGQPVPAPPAVPAEPGPAMSAAAPGWGPPPAAGSYGYDYGYDQNYPAQGHPASADQQYAYQQGQQGQQGYGYAQAGYDQPDESQPRYPEGYAQELIAYNQAAVEEHRDSQPAYEPPYQPPYEPPPYEPEPVEEVEEAVVAAAEDAEPMDITPEVRDEIGGLPPRAVSAILGVVAAMLAGALGAGGGLLNPTAYLVVVVFAQLLVAAVWVFGGHSANRWGVAGVSLAAALVADTFMLLQAMPLGSLGYHVTRDSGAGPDLSAVVGVVAIAWIAMILVQLGRGRRRAQVTEAFGAAMVLTVTMVGYGAAIALVRNDGAGVLAGFLAMAGAAALLSHLTDAALPKPGIAPGVPRGIVGLAVGAVGAAAAGVVTAKLVGIGPVYAGLLGLGVGLVTMLLDLGQAYAVAGRLAAGEQLAGSTVRPLLGPCLALAMTVIGAWTYGAVVL
jgi:hypothetical protein